MEKKEHDNKASYDLRSEPSSSLQSVTEDEESDDTSSPAECSLSSYGPERRKQRRNESVLLKRIESMLVEWIEENPSDLYPTVQEKEKLAVEYGMTLRQVNYRFVIARRKMRNSGLKVWKTRSDGLPGENGLTRLVSCVLS